MESAAEIEYISGFFAVGKDLLKLYTDNSKRPWLYVLSVEGVCWAHWWGFLWGFKFSVELFLNEI